MKLYFSNSTDEVPLTKPNHLFLLRTEIRVTLSRPTCIDNSTATLLVHILRFTDQLLVRSQRCARSYRREGSRWIEKGGEREVTHYKRTAFRYTVNIPYSESRLHRWLIYGRIEHSWNMEFIAAYVHSATYVRRPSLIRPSNIYWKGRLNHRARIVRSD